MVDDLYPFQSNYYELGGLRYHYLDEGSGEPVVLLHGNPTWSFYYRNLIKALRGSYRVIAPDHMGCGLSDKPSDERYSYRLERRVEDLEHLLNHLGLSRGLSLVLHDWGGMIGMTYAHRHPEAVRRLVIMNSAAFHLPAGKRLPWSLWFCRDPILGPFLVRGLNLFCLVAARICCRRKPMPADVRRHYLAPYDSWKNRIAILRFVQDIPLRPGDTSYPLVEAVEQALEQFQALPMLICWGEKDFVFDHKILSGWAKRFPQARIHKFADAGHYVLEDAGEEIIPRIQEFLSAHPIAVR